MQRRSLTELAGNPDLISGIYNYCDRWCERCPLTSRCLVYATENEDDDSSVTHDLSNEAFWHKLRSVFQETRDMIAEWAREAGVDFDKIEEEEVRRNENAGGSKSIIIRSRGPGRNMRTTRATGFASWTRR